MVENPIELEKLNSIKRLTQFSNLDKKKLKEMKDAFLEAVRKRATERKVGVMFSGGIDSTMIAAVAKNFTEVVLYSVGTKNSEDLKFAEEVDEELQLSLRIKILNEEEAIETYKKVQRLIDFKDFLQVELAIPVFLCSEMAKEDGIKVLLSGQGAEALFAGYDRHLKCYLNGGNLRKMLLDELLNLNATDLDRDMETAMLNQCELRYPFLDYKFIELVWSIKPELNLSKNGEKKLVLKKIAKELKTPEIAYERPKRAMQYGSGIHKILIRAARKNLIS